MGNIQSPLSYSHAYSLAVNRWGKKKKKKNNIYVTIINIAWKTGSQRTAAFNIHWNYGVTAIITAICASLSKGAKVGRFKVRAQVASDARRCWTGSACRQAVAFEPHAGHDVAPADIPTKVGARGRRAANLWHEEHGARCFPQLFFRDLVLCLFLVDGAQPLRPLAHLRERLPAGPLVAEELAVRLHLLYRRDWRRDDASRRLIIIEKHKSHVWQNKWNHREFEYTIEAHKMYMQRQLNIRQHAIHRYI